MRMIQMSLQKKKLFIPSKSTNANEKSRN